MDNKKVIAVYNEGLEGIEIYNIIYGINEKVVWKHTTEEKSKKPHISNIYTTIKGRNYFKAFNRRIFLDECLRVC